MFTNDKSLIENIEINDWLNKGELHEIEADQMLSITNERPMTASGLIDECQISSKPFSKTDSDGRPITSAIKGKSLTTKASKDLAKITENDSKSSSILGINDA